MRKVFYQRGERSKFHPYFDPVLKKEFKPAQPYMFGRGWRKFRKHRFETNQGGSV